MKLSEISMFLGKSRKVVIKEMNDFFTTKKSVEKVQSCISGEDEEFNVLEAVKVFARINKNRRLNKYFTYKINYYVSRNKKLFNRKDFPVHPCFACRHFSLVIDKNGESDPENEKCMHPANVKKDGSLIKRYIHTSVNNMGLCLSFRVGNIKNI